MNYRFIIIPILLIIKRVRWMFGIIQNQKMSFLCPATHSALYTANIHSSGTATSIAEVINKKCLSLVINDRMTINHAFKTYSNIPRISI